MLERVGRMIPHGWKMVPLLKCVKGKGEYGANASAALYDSELPRFVRITDIIDSGKISQEDKKSIAEDKAESFILKEGDFLFARTGATVGKTYRYIPNGERQAYAGYLIKFQIDSNKINPRYLELYTQTSRYWDWVKNTSRAGAQPNINAQEFGELEILLPTNAEQEKLCIVFDYWDRSIDLTEHLIAAKKERRKWLMQQLLTGTRRLPGFKKSNKLRKTPFGTLPADWGYPIIGDVAKEVSERNGDESTRPVLSCTKHQGLVDSLTYFGKRIFSADLSNYKVVRRHQFAYATNHIDEGSIGYQDSYDEALISPIYTVFQTNDTMDDRFLFFVLKTETYRHIFSSNTSASVDRRGSLRWRDFAKIRVPHPSVEEQKAIVKVINTADRELDLLRSQREALREQKKGLMQQLLTGKRRLKLDNKSR